MEPTGVEDALAAARLWAVMQQPYLSAVLFAMTFVPWPGLGTFGVDRCWRLYYDPDCLERWTTPGAGAVLVHEAGHLLRDHRGRAETLELGPSDQWCWNVATDCEINDDLGDFPLPGGVFPSTFQLPAGDLAEVYFSALTVGGGASSVRLQGQAGHSQGQLCAGGSGVDGMWREWERADDGVTGVRPGEEELIRQQVAAEVRRLVNAGDHIPSSVARWADAFLYPRPAPPSRRRGRRHLRLDGPPGPCRGHQRGGRHLALRRGQRAGHRCPLLRHRRPSGQEVFGPAILELRGGGGTDLGAGLGAVAALRPPCDICIVLTDGITRWPDRNPGRARTIIALTGSHAGMARARRPGWAELIEIPR